MRRTAMRHRIAGLLLVAIALVANAVVAVPACAQNHVEGSLVVDGKATPLTQVYAYSEPGFFDKKKLDVVVLICDAAVSPVALHDDFARRDQVKAGKLHCVRQTIDASKQVINYRIEHQRFQMTPSGGSSYQVFEAKTFDGKTV